MPQNEGIRNVANRFVTWAFGDPEAVSSASRVEALRVESHGVENLGVELPPGAGRVDDAPSILRTRPNNVVGSLADALASGFMPSRSIIFQKGPVVFDGEYRLKADTLNKYGLPTFEHFGRTEVVHAFGSFMVHPHQFDLGDGKRGVRLLGVSDANGGNNPVNLATEESIRKRMGVSEGRRCPIEIVYWHPETNGQSGEGLWREFPGEGRKGSLITIAKEGGGPQSNATHRGGTVGLFGQTQNAPETYHGRQFKVGGYPAIAIGMSIEGVHPDVMASQKENASLLLNDGVNFSRRPYKNDFVRIIDVNTTLMFARDWILFRAMERGVLPNDSPLIRPGLKDYLGSEEWTTYCGEHRGAVDFLSTSLTFTKEGFQEVYGEQGAELWNVYSKVMDQVIEARGIPKKSEANPSGASPESCVDPETGEHFTPLWKMLGHQASEVRPFESPEQYDEYHKARKEGADAIERYRQNGGVVPLAPGRALPYAPQTNADLIVAFIEKFHPWVEVGGFQCAAAVVAFMPEATSRHGITPEVYLALTAPVINKLLIADALAEGATDQFFAGAKENLAKTLNALIPADMEAPKRAAMEAQFAQIAALGTQGLLAQKDALQAQIRENGGPVPKLAAHQKLREMIAVDIEKARGAEVGDMEVHVQHNIPPALLLDVVHGLHHDKKWNDDLVKWHYLGTLMDDSELERA